MSVTVQMMAGTIHSFNIFEGYRIRNLRYELYIVLRNEDTSFTDSDRIVFSNREYEQIDDDMEYVEDGNHYYIFVREEAPPPLVRLTLGDNGLMCLRNESGRLIRYCGWDVEDRLDDEPVAGMPDQAVIEADISDEAYNVMREDIRWTIVEDEDDEDNLENDRVLEIFCERFVGVPSFEIVILSPIRT